MPKPTRKKRAQPTKTTASPKLRKVQLGLMVVPEVKSVLLAEAQRTGQTMSQVGEAMIEKARIYESMLRAMNTSLDEMRRGNLTSELYRAGFVPVIDRGGKVWLEPDHALAKHFAPGFVPWKPGEQRPGAVTVEVEINPNTTPAQDTDPKVAVGSATAKTRDKAADPSADQNQRLIEEGERLMAKLYEIKRKLDEAHANTHAADEAAKKSGKVA